MHGGRVSAASGRSGKGASFVVKLPIVAASAAEQASAGTMAERQAPQVRNKKRVLTVEDNRDAADALALLLSGQGHEARAADKKVVARMKLPKSSNPTSR